MLWYIGLVSFLFLKSEANLLWGGVFESDLHYVSESDFV